MTGEKLKKLRKTYGLTQKGLAKQLGVTQTAIWRWENGEPMLKAHEEKVENFFDNFESFHVLTVGKSKGCSHFTFDTSMKNSDIIQDIMANYTLNIFKAIITSDSPHKTTLVIECELEELNE